MTDPSYAQVYQDFKLEQERLVLEEMTL